MAVLNNDFRSDGTLRNSIAFLPDDNKYYSK